MKTVKYLSLKEKYSDNLKILVSVTRGKCGKCDQGYDLVSVTRGMTW